MLTINDIEKMVNTNTLDPNYEYYLEDCQNGFSLVIAKSKSVFHKDAIICCKPTKECQMLLDKLSC